MLDTATRPVARPPKAVGVAWTLLIINTLGSTGAKTVLPLPRSVSQLITMGCLGVAFLIALALNSKLRVRPSAYLALLSVLLVSSTVASLDLEGGFGALFRCFRFALFLATLWLLTRWWDGGTELVRHHIRAYTVVLVTVVIGLVLSPGNAMPFDYGGRLTGALWPLTPPQVGQYAAIVIGLTVLLWLGGRLDRRTALLVIIPSLGILLLTHTRTATLGLVAGTVVALLSQWMSSARARKVFTGLVVTGLLVTVVLGGLVQAWFLRGQSEENFSSLTGRAKVWDALLAAPRTTLEYLFGVGLTDKSYDGLPIDSSWLAVYHEQGYVGIVLVASFLLVLVVVAVLRPPSLARACAIFLITYCLSASFTEAGFGDASPYLLHLALAASLLVRPPAEPKETG
ncbi:O-antigen ligase domain-containing protein [Amycolatopsis sp. 195334CR]|uniref:O-antigen ligase domain-containing protein n=1 Tax=Amycolatopsis sp. 195334CR TaxID=2814588 RepID=UPI001A8EA7DB|nr:O-antigen ligase domain-containing protein [Amycolatopsis sp. 195334CR]MBN6040467.1 O-antigen ligase domain-containing protein [Amycolatopsis sp. 195334CR]